VIKSEINTVLTQRRKDAEKDEEVPSFSNNIKIRVISSAVVFQSSLEPYGLVSLEGLLRRR